MAYSSLKSGLLFDSNVTSSALTSAKAYVGTSSAATDVDFAGTPDGAVVVTLNPKSLSVTPGSNVVLLQGANLSLALQADGTSGYKIALLNGSTVFWTSNSTYEFDVEHTLAVSWSRLNVSGGGSVGVYLDGRSLGSLDTLTLVTGGTSDPDFIPVAGYNGYLSLVAGFTSDVSSQLERLTESPALLKYAAGASNRAPSVVITDGAATETATVVFPVLSPGESISVAGRVVTNNSPDTNADASTVASVFASNTSSATLAVTSTLTGFVAGTPSGASVVFTSTTPNTDVTTILTSTTDASAHTKAPTSVTTVDGYLDQELVTVTFNSSQAPKAGDTIYFSSEDGELSKSFTYSSSDAATNLTALVNGIGQKVPEIQVLTVGHAAGSNYAAGNVIQITYYKDASTTPAGSISYTVKAADIVASSEFLAVSSTQSVRDSLAYAATQANIASAIAQSTGGTLGVYKVSYAGGNQLTLTESSPLGVDIRASEVTVKVNSSASATTSADLAFATSQSGGSALFAADGSSYRITTSGNNVLSLESSTTGDKSDLAVKFIDAAGVELSSLGYSFDLSGLSSSSWKVGGLGSSTSPAAALLLFGDLDHLIPSNQSSATYGGGSSNTGGGTTAPSTQAVKTNGPIYAELIPSSFAVANGASTATVSYNLFIDKSQDVTPSGYNSFGYTLQVDPAVATLPSANYFSLPAGASFSTVNDTARSSGSLSVQWVALASVGNYKTNVGTLTLNVPLENGKAPEHINMSFSDISIDSQYYSYSTAGTPPTSSSSYQETLITDAYPVTFALKRDYNYTAKSVSSFTTSAASVNTTTAHENPGVSGVYIEYQVSKEAQAGEAYMHIEQASPVTSASTTRGLDLSVHAAALSTGEARTLVIDLPASINYDTVRFTPGAAGGVTSTYVPGSHSIVLVQSPAATENLGVLHVDLAATLATPVTSSFSFNSVTKTVAAQTVVETGVDLTSGYGVTDSVGILTTPPLPRGSIEYRLTDPVLAKTNTDKITVEDARAVLGLAAGNPSVTALGVSPSSSYLSDLLAADFNGDGRVTGADVINLMNYVVATNKGALKWVYLDQANAAAVGTKTSFIAPASLEYSTDQSASSTMAAQLIQLTGVLVGDLVTAAV